jgi:wobble nucleotide-excising tRNase
MPPPSLNRLKALDSLTGFGLFRNFIWDTTQLEEFDRYNLIYGWNYSGKTTLSRAFQCVEDASLHSDFAGGTFQFIKGDRTEVNSLFSTPLPHIRVFNRHFVQRNFHEGSDMTGANDIAVLGETNQALKDRLANLESRITRAESFKTKLTNDATDIQKYIDDAGTAQARVVIGIVGGPYNRRHLEDTISSLPSKVWPIPLNNESLEQKKEEFRKATDFISVSLFSPDHSGIIRVIFKIREALREVATNTAINSLQENNSLERWVQTGLDLNTSETPCGFCGANISQSRWTELQGHFSEAFTTLQKKLQSLCTTVNSLSFDAPTIAETSLFPDLRPRFKRALSDLLTSLDSSKKAAEEIDTILEVKLQSLEIPKELEFNFEPAKKLRAHINIFNDILDEHNDRVESADTVKSESKRAICEHFAVEYLRDSKVLEKKEQKEILNARAFNCNSVSTRIRNQVSLVNQAIKNASIAVRRINENLSILLPDDNIEVVKLNDTDFQFQRGGQVAKNMSEGERTAVAFSYFLTKLEEGTTPIEEIIVVLDDPISSLDSNHIYAVHSITENRLAKARQLFILTHNSSFFGMTKDWMKKKNGRFYMTQRQLGTDQEWHSSLVRLPKLLKKFKSDYQYTYYCLKVINDDPAPQLEHLCGVPNMIRRVLEAYLGFVFPESGGWADKLPMIIENEEICGKIKKFSDENSHSHSLAQATEVPDYIAHCKEIIQEVLTALNNHNPAHVSSLEAEFFSEAGNLP